VSDTPLPPDPLWALPEPVPAGRLGGLALGVSVGFFVVIGATLQSLDPGFGIWFTEIFLFLGAGWVLTRWSGRDPVRYARLGWPGAAPVVLGLLFSVGNYFALVVPLQFVSQLLAPKAWVDFFDQMQIFDRHGGLALLLLSSGAVLAAPLGEEYVFRGLFLQGLLASRWRVSIAVVASAAIFSAVHLDPIGFLARMELGVLFGLLFVRTGSLWPGMAAHLGSNLTATLLYFLGRGDPSPAAEMRAEVAGVGVAAAVGCLILAGVLWVAHRRPSVWGAPQETDARQPRISLRRAALPWVAAALAVLAGWGAARHAGLGRPTVEQPPTADAR
jgi:membrane protease YdiL (CAAX protease family)